MPAFYEFAKLPRGTLTLTVDRRRADVWAFGHGAKWNVLDLDSLCYVGAGDSDSIDEACEAALDVLTRA